MAEPAICLRSCCRLTLCNVLLEGCRLIEENADAMLKIVAISFRNFGAASDSSWRVGECLDQFQASWIDESKRILLVYVIILDYTAFSLILRRSLSRISFFSLSLDDQAEYIQQLVVQCVFRSCQFGPVATGVFNL